MRNAVFSVVCSFLVLNLLQSAYADVLFDPKNAHSIIIGYRQPGDIVLTEAHVKYSWSLFRTLRKTQTFVNDGSSVITKVEVSDLATNGHGAKATIVGGGPGYKYVTIEFVSENSRGIDYQVRVYGKRLNNYYNQYNTNQYN